MRKFYIESMKGITSVIEVECEQVTLVEDASLAWRVLPNESMWRITKPQSMCKQVAKGIFEFPVVMSWAIFDDAESALEKAKKDVTEDLRRGARKAGLQFNVVDAIAKANLIEIKRLD